MDSGQEMTEGEVIYDIPSDPVSGRMSDPATSGNTAYGVLQGVQTAPNPVYEQVQMHVNVQR